MFVFPEELEFVSEDDAAHKQVLTVYNPYDFNIRFQGQCPAWRWEVKEHSPLTFGQRAVLS